EVTVTATLTMDDGWHISANPASADFLIATVVEVRDGRPASSRAAGSPAVEVVEVVYPAPTTLRGRGLGAEPINVYGGAARALVRVRLPEDAAPGTTLPLRVLAKFQACSDRGVCLAPAEWTGEASIAVKGKP